MLWKRAAGLVLLGGLVAGCQTQTPKASVAVEPVSDATVAQLQESWKAAHPGSVTGYVNAVIPENHTLQVAGFPLDQIHRGDVVSILLNGQVNSVVTARVYDKKYGYVQMDYGPLTAGQSDPRDGDLAVWYPGGVAVSPMSGQPAPTSAGPATPAPAAEAPAPQPAPPAPAPSAATPAPAPAPAAPEPAASAPAASATPAAPAPTPSQTPTPAPQTKTPADLNK